MFKISVGRDPKTQLYASMAQIQLYASNSQDNLFRAWRHPYYSLISCLGVYYDNGDCHILGARAPIDKTPGLLTRIVQAQPNWMIKYN